MVNSSNHAHVSNIRSIEICFAQMVHYFARPYEHYHNALQKNKDNRQQQNQLQNGNFQPLLPTICWVYCKCCCYKIAEHKIISHKQMYYTLVQWVQLAWEFIRSDG